MLENLIKNKLLNIKFKHHLRCSAKSHQYQENNTGLADTRATAPNLLEKIYISPPLR